MIACIFGFTTSEFVDELTLAYMSIFIPSQPPAFKFDYATFLANKMLDQFMRLENETVFKYSSILYHLFLYYQSDKFPFSLQKLDTKGNPMSIIFWTSIFHNSPSSPKKLPFPIYIINKNPKINKYSYRGGLKNKP